MWCTVATLDLPTYPGGKDFLAAYKKAYGSSNPDPYAIYGYEAMKLGLDTIASLGSNGNSRPAILKALLATKDRHSVLGTYSFDRNGDTTLRSCGLYKVKGRRGTLVFVRNVNSPAAPPAEHPAGRRAHRQPRRPNGPHPTERRRGPHAAHSVRG